MSQSNHRRVWTQGDANIYIYREDEDGELISEEQILEYCYGEGVTLSISADIKRRAVTGRGRRKIIVPSCGYDTISLSIEHFFFDKKLEYDPIFLPHNQLRIKVEFYELTYQEVENDIFILSFAFPVSFSINGNNAGEMNATATFEAEKLLPVDN